MGTWWVNLRSRSLAARAVFLGLFVAGFFALLAPLVAWWRGAAGVGAAAVAAAACLAGAGTALLVSDRLPRAQHALVGLLLAMGARMGIPLALAAGCLVCGGALVEAGVLFYLLIFYPLTLGVETALSLAPPAPRVPGSKVSEDAVS
jgi:hypothetical protein